jgi:hypothetical protein
MRALGSVARIGIVTFASMMALQQLGVGQQLITLAFSLILGAACLAAALAFGLGGRDVAGRIVAREYDRRKTTPPPPPSPEERTSGVQKVSPGE